jgi:hypothetical protein
MPLLHRIWRYFKAVCHYWGALVTGGFVIGFLAVWQGTGHNIKLWISIDIAIIAILIATFRAWDDQVNTIELAAKERNQQNHKKSIEAVEVVYSRIVDIEQHSWKFIFQGAYDQQNRTNNLNKLNAEIRDFYFLIDKNSPFLPEKLCDKARKFTEILAKHVVKVGVYNSIDAQQADFRRERIEAAKAAFDAYEKEIPDLKRDLENNFRKMLGIER